MPIPISVSGNWDGIGLRRSNGISPFLRGGMPSLNPFHNGTVMMICWATGFDVSFYSGISL